MEETDRYLTRFLMLVLSILLKKKKLATLADKIAEVISVVFNAALIQLK